MNNHMIKTFDPWDNLFNPVVILNELKRIYKNSINLSSALYENDMYLDELRPWIMENEKGIFLKKNEIPE